MQSFLVYCLVRSENTRDVRDKMFQWMPSLRHFKFSLLTAFITPFQQFTTVAAEVRGKEEDIAAWFFFLPFESHEKKSLKKEPRLT